MTRANVWQTFTQPRWPLPAASPWRGTAVGTPRSRSGQHSLQGMGVQPPWRQQENLFFSSQVQGWGSPSLLSKICNPRAELQEFEDS